MAGAAVLCARGALRTGAGLVQVSVPKELYPVIHAGVPEATCISRRTSQWNLERCQAVAIGPGLGEAEENLKLITTVLTQCRATVVADADCLNLLARHRNLWLAQGATAADADGAAEGDGGFRCQLIVTPHPGEAARLLACSTAQINKDREESARKLARMLSAVVVLKGAPTVVSTPDGKTYTNSTGNPGMATGGSGDVLTGVIASLAGQGLQPLPAACCGVYLHGLAGDLGAQRWGEYGLMASDLADFMALAIERTLSQPENLGV